MGWLPVPGPLMSSALPVFDRESFSITGADEDHQSLIWVLGWPWAGRELVLAALAQIEGAQMLPLAEGATRHEHLGLFAGEPYSVQIDQDQIHQMRRRYLRGADENAKVWVDPYPCKAADLIRMRQVFPKSVAIRVNCSPEYLALQWHLAGYAAVDSMIEAWKSEQVALDHLMDSPEIRIISVSLDALLDPQRCAETVVELISALGQSANPKMSAHVQALIQRHGYRSPNHWEYYFK